MKKSFEKILEAFESKFPECWAKPGDEFSSSEYAVIWSGEDSWVGEEAAFNYDSCWEDPKERTWTMGVHNALVEFAKKYGCYWQCNDPGTYIMYEN